MPARKKSGLPTYEQKEYVLLKDDARRKFSQIIGLAEQLRDRELLSSEELRISFTNLFREALDLRMPKSLRDELRALSEQGPEADEHPDYNEYQ